MKFKPMLIAAALATAIPAAPVMAGGYHLDRGDRHHRVERGYHKDFGYQRGPNRRFGHKRPYHHQAKRHGHDAGAIAIGAAALALLFTLGH